MAESRSTPGRWASVACQAIAFLAVNLPPLFNLHRCLHRRPPEGKTAGVVFVADDLAAWLVGLLADAGRRKLATLVLGSDQERALRQAAEATVETTAAELAPAGGEQAGQLALVVSEVFGATAPRVTLAGQATLLEALQAGIAGRLAVLDDPAVTGTEQSSAELLEMPGGVLGEALARHLVREIMVRESGGGPLMPLADQLNHDVTHLQGQRLEGMLAQLAGQVRALAQAGGALRRCRGSRCGCRRGRCSWWAGRICSPNWAGGWRPGVMVGRRSWPSRGWVGRGRPAWRWSTRTGTWARSGWPGSSRLRIRRCWRPGSRAGRPAWCRSPARYRDPVASVHGVLAVYPAEWLLVFDNTPGRASVEKFLPPAGRGRVLVTSQNPNWPPGQVLDVPVLDIEVAAEFLAARTGDQDQRAATELAAEVGGLPLALEQAAAYIQATGGSLAGYVSLFRDRRADLLAPRRSYGAPGGCGGHLGAGLVPAGGRSPGRGGPGAAAGVPGARAGAAGPAARRCAGRWQTCPRGLRPRSGRCWVIGSRRDAIAALRPYSLVTQAGDGLVLVHRLATRVGCWVERLNALMLNVNLAGVRSAHSAAVCSDGSA